MASPSAKIPRGRQSEPAGSGRRERLYQELARKMMSAIDEGKYKVGERLPAERELAGEFDVSRPTVREAIIPALNARARNALFTVEVVMVPK